MSPHPEPPLTLVESVRHRAAAPPLPGPRGSDVSQTWPTWFLVTALLVLAFNLRPAVTSLGAVLVEVSADLRMPAAVAGVLTTLPLLCFAAFGAGAASLGRRFGAHHVIVGALLAVVVGLVVRSAIPFTPVFVVATVVALGGMATGNVLIPAFVKTHFPGRIGIATAAYTTMMAVGTTIPAGLTVPIGNAVGGWPVGLGVWAATAAVALVPWILLAWRDHPRRPRRTAERSRHLTLRDIGRSPLAWSLALYFGLQAAQAYAAFGWLAQIFRDHGIDPTHAGFLLSIIPVAGIPMSLAFPTIAGRLANQRWLVVTCCLSYVGGYIGLLTAPRAGAVLWVILIGMGTGAFPLTLTMIGLRSRSHEVTARLSGFVQSIGYLVAAGGPLAVGALYGVTGGWTVPIGLLLVLVVPQLALGLSAARNRFVDDELPQTPGRGRSGVTTGSA